jgi:hypothetical protein
MSEEDNPSRAEEEDTPSILGSDDLNWWRPRPTIVVNNDRGLKIVERKRPRLWRPEGPDPA